MGGNGRQVILLDQPRAFRENNLNTVTRCKIAALNTAREFPNLKRLPWQARVGITLIENKKVQRMMKNSTIIDKTSRFNTHVVRRSSIYSIHTSSACSSTAEYSGLHKSRFDNSKQNGELQSVCERLLVVLRRVRFHMPVLSREYAKEGESLPVSVPS